MMASTLYQILSRFILILAVVAIASSTARPHFGDGSQDTEEQENKEYPGSEGQSLDYGDDGAKSDDWGPSTGAKVKLDNRRTKSNDWNEFMDYDSVNAKLDNRANSDDWDQSINYDSARTKLDNMMVKSDDWDQSANYDSAKTSSDEWDRYYDQEADLLRTLIASRSGPTEMRRSVPVKKPATADQDSSNLIDTTGLTNDQLEQIVQRLEEYTNRLPVGWDRLVRGPEMKRQSRFRQCYFNPVSCFKK